MRECGLPCIVLHSGWLDGTQAVALIEGVVEIVGDSVEVFRHRKVMFFAYGIGATNTVRKEG